MSIAARHTPLHAAHVATGARMVDFAGWDMPVNYGSQLEEHHAVRRDAGMFDVSHMLALDVAGPGPLPGCAACSPMTSPSSRAVAKRSTPAC